MSGFVYFIGPEALMLREEDSELAVVKIGFTGAHPYARLQQLQTGSPVPLDLLFFMRADEQVERVLHEVFQEQGSHLEWFHLSGPLRAGLQCLCDVMREIGHLTHEPLPACIFQEIMSKHTPELRRLQSRLEVV